jgi:hypothetical protein
LIKQPISFGRLVKRPAVGINLANINAALGDEIRAFGLAE